MHSVTNYVVENRREKRKEKMRSGMLRSIKDGKSYQLMRGSQGWSEV